VIAGRPTAPLFCLKLQRVGEAGVRRLMVIAAALAAMGTGAKADSDFLLVGCIRSTFGPCTALPTLRYLVSSQCDAAREKLRSDMGAGNVSASCVPADPRWNRALFPEK
jgi:hypothetical protein